MLLYGILLVGWIAAGQTSPAAAEEPQSEIRRLVRNLDAPQLADRDAAEAELLRRGPNILDLLPATTDRTPAETRRRLDRIRNKLQQQAAEAMARPSTVTLHAETMPLSEILESFQKQTGNAITRRDEPSGRGKFDPTLKVGFDKTPFWRAMDDVLDRTRTAVDPFAERTSLHVVPAPGAKAILRTGRAYYTGPFRIEPTSVVARRDFRRVDGRSLAVIVETAWEPRVQVIGFSQRMADVSVADDRGRKLSTAEPDARFEAVPSGESAAVQFQLPLQLPPRDARWITRLRGKLTAMISGRTETFRFRDIAAAKNVEQRIAAATVTLERAQKNSDAWEIRIRVRFDDAGDALASHRTWIFNNEAYLEGPDGARIANEGYETTRQTKNEVGVAYLFTAEQALERMTFVYKTPAAILTRDFEYELKDIQLP